MHFQLIPAPAISQGQIRSFWGYDSGANFGKEKLFQPAVDGCPGIVYQRGGTRTLVDHRGKLLPRLFLYGQSTQTQRIFSNSSFALTGASLPPQGLKAIFGMDAHLLTDGCLEIGSLELLEQLESTSSVEGQVVILAGFLADLKEQNRFQADHRVNHALEAIIRHKGSLPLRELRRMIDISERSLERGFKHAVGISPKMFSRVCRFQQALFQLNRDGFVKLSDLAYGNHYADQSHFIRDFKRFSGFTPRRYHALGEYFVKSLPELVC